MQYRRLGNSGLQVSPLCLGTMSFGERTSPEESGRIIAMARDAGVNFIDTADVNAGGESERLIGRWTRGDRDRWVICTKLGGAMGAGPNRAGLGRKWMFSAVDESLRRLGSDYIDIYCLDVDDPRTPVDEIVSSLGNLVRAGKIRYWGVSNIPAWRITEFVLASDRVRIPRPVMGQPCYNAMSRMAEIEYLPACHRFGLGVAVYSPLARGVLSGKYLPGQVPGQDTRAAHRDPRLMETEYREDSMVLAQEIKEYAQARGMSAAQFALNWVLNNRLVTAAIAGPRTADQWRHYLDALEHPFTSEDEDFIDSLVPAGHASTPGYTDPRYPVAGRVSRVETPG